MSSYGAIISFGILLISVFPFIFGYLYTMMNYQNMVNDLISTKYDIERSRLKTSIRILANSSNWSDPTHLNISILNNGDSSIWIKDFSKISLILVYYSHGDKIISFIPYDQSQVGGAYWYVVNITDDKLGYEVTNPINLTIGSGAWDSNEIINIQIVLDPSLARDANSNYIIIVSTPDGFTDYVGGK